MRGMIVAAVALLVAASCGRKDDAPTSRPSLSGRAIDADGRPLAGAVFSATPVPPTINSSTMPSTADAAGEFAFAKLADGDWDVRCSWDGAVNVLVATVRLPAVDRLDFRLPDGGVIAGTLVDAATKAPIAGATLRFREARTIATATTDAAGRFSVKAHRSSTLVKWVEVESPGAIWRTILLERYDWQCVVEDGGRQELTLEAKRAVDLTGTVTGPDGPLTGVEVHAWFEGPTRIKEQTTRTDAAGRYRFEDVQDAAAWVVAAAPGYVVAAPDARNPRIPSGPDETIRSTSPEDGAAWVVDIEMKAATSCAVSGRVVDADGKPVAGATVGAGTRVHETGTRSGADGTFAIPRAVVGADDAVRVTASSGKASASVAAAVADGRAEDVQLVVKSPPRVHGVVRRKSGAPAPGAKVSASDGDDDRPVAFVPPAADTTAVAAADGSYSLEMPDASRKFAVYAVAPGAARTFVKWVDPADAPTDETLDVVLDDEATLVGRVVKKGTKEPVAGVFVCEMSGRDAGDDGADPRVIDYVDALTDADGRFKLPHVGGDCFVRAHRDGWLLAYVKHVDPAEGEVVIELPPELSIEGCVAFDDGSPAAGADVWIAHGEGDSDCIREPGDSGSTTTDADGRFALRKIDEGPWTIGVRGDAAGFVARKLGGVAGGTRDLRIAVKRGTKIVGRVCGADDKPIAHAHVFALTEDRSRPHPEVETASDGSFALTCLDDGEYVVHVEAADHLPAGRTMRGNGGAAAFRLEEGLDVEGRLVDPDGGPGLSVFVRLESLAGESERIGNFGQTDADGRFRIGGLVPGPHLLTISYAGTWRFEAPEKFVVEAGATDVVVKCVPKPK